MYSKTTNNLYENVHYSIVSKSEERKLNAFSTKIIHKEAMKAFHKGILHSN